MPEPSSVTNARAISVAIAVYNGAAYITALLDSIARQTLLPSEVVVSDNASTDDTIAVVEAFAGRAPFNVRVHRNPTNIGVLENFYCAFSLCSHALIAYCDCDDVWDPEKLAKCAAAFHESGVVLASHSSRLTDAELKPLGVVLPDGLEPGRYRFPHYPLRYWGFGHQMLFARELLPIMNHLRATAPAASVAIASLDSFIPIVAGMLGDTVYIPEPLLDFRRHQGAVTFRHTIYSYAPSASGSAPSRQVKKRLGLAERRTTAAALRDWVVSEKLEDANDGERWARYVKHLDEVIRALDARLSIYQSTHLPARARAFVTALIAGAYRDGRKWGAGSRQIPIDLLALLMPARESGEQPRTDATPAVATIEQSQT
jgi:glycosyltransferase involved in cell wall biosynthesis